MVTEISEQPAAPPVEAVVAQPAVAPAPVAETTPLTAPATPVAEAAKPVSAAPIVVEAAKPATPAPSPAVAPEVQEYIKRLEQQNQTAQAQEDARTLEQAVTTYAQLLEREQGLTAEQATYVAKRAGDMAFQQYQTEKTRQTLYIAALDIGKEYGVDPRILMNLPTADAMRAAGQAATGQNRLAAEVERLKAENAALKKASVPAQTFASGAVGGDGGKPTKDNIDGLYLKDPERYGATYRKFLATGEIS